MVENSIVQLERTVEGVMYPGECHAAVALVEDSSVATNFGPMLPDKDKLFKELSSFNPMYSVCLWDAVQLQAGVWFFHGDTESFLSIPSKGQHPQSEPL